MATTGGRVPLSRMAANACGERRRRATRAPKGPMSGRREGGGTDGSGQAQSERAAAKLAPLAGESGVRSACSLCCKLRCSRESCCSVALDSSRRDCATLHSCCSEESSARTSLSCSAAPTTLWGITDVLGVSRRSVEGMDCGVCSVPR